MKYARDSYMSSPLAISRHHFKLFSWLLRHLLFTNRPASTPKNCIIKYLIKFLIDKHQPINSDHKTLNGWITRVFCANFSFNILNPFPSHLYNNGQRLGPLRYNYKFITLWSWRSVLMPLERYLIEICKSIIIHESVHMMFALGYNTHYIYISDSTCRSLKVIKGLQRRQYCKNWLHVTNFLFHNTPTILIIGVLPGEETFPSILLVLNV